MCYLDKLKTVLAPGQIFFISRQNGINNKEFRSKKSEQKGISVVLKLKLHTENQKQKVSMSFNIDSGKCKFIFSPALKKLKIYIEGEDIKTLTDENLLSRLRFIYRRFENNPEIDEIFIPFQIKKPQ